jgi:hypothetical protein
MIWKKIKRPGWGVNQGSFDFRLFYRHSTAEPQWLPLVFKPLFLEFQVFESNPLKCLSIPAKESAVRYLCLYVCMYVCTLHL